MTHVPNYPDSFAQPLVSIGSVDVTENQVITPVGSWPLSEVNVSTFDQTWTRTYTPGWAIFMMVFFIWFFMLSLLFLFAKERHTSGHVTILIQAGPYSYTEQLPVGNALQHADVFNRVAYLQGLIGQSRR